MVTDQVMAEVKAAVSGCLPGIETAEVRIHEELGSMPAEMMKGGRVSKMVKNESRYVVTFSKSVPNARQVHRHYARATIENGKMVKLAVSR
jgi:hypothetical protein